MWLRKYTCMKGGWEPESNYMYKYKALQLALIVDYSILFYSE